jgi:PAS domain-containing protein
MSSDDQDLQEATAVVRNGDRTWTSQDLAALDDLMSRVRDRSPDDADALALEVELATAHEELRVADEELRAQRDQLEQLLELNRTSSAQRRQVAAMLPVPILTTDEAGLITQANAAAAALLNVPLVRLLGKPIVTFVRDGHRSEVRSALSRVGTDPAQLRVDLTPRRSGPVAADLVLASEPRGSVPVDVEWTVLTPGTAYDGGGDPGVDPLRLAAAVTAISRLPVAEHDLRSLLGAIARIARTALDESAAVSANLGRPDAPTHLAFTAEDASVADGLQMRAGEGPCIDAYDDQETVVTDDVRVDPRWPRLEVPWQSSPVVSVLAIPIMAGGAAAGVLNCYSRARAAFSESQAQAAEVLGLAAGAALEAIEETNRLRNLAAQLDRALESRAVIDQAKGIVMARRGCSAEDAFAHLATLSQQRNVKLRDLAQALVEQTTASPPGVTRRRS